MGVGGLNLFGLHQYDGLTSFFGDGPPLSQGVGYGIVVGFGAAFAVLTTTLVYLDYKYGGTKYHSEGIAGPFWYAAGATIQILLLGVLAVEIKRKAPSAHTVLEIVKARWGRTAHKVMFFFCIVTNIVVSTQLILGGSAVITALTGMSVYAACMLIPLGITLYTATGGLKATFTSSYIHTVIIYVTLILFCVTVYGTSPKLGSPSVVIGGFGTVFVDQSYWQSAIAAKPSASWKGYLLGGLMWFSIPFALATSLGLSVVALDLPLTIDEGNLGLVPPAAALAILGNGGAILVVVILFMAVTSSGSAELIAVSSLISYDIYREYINPRATGKQMLLCSRISVCIFAVCMGVIAIIFSVANVSLNFIFLVGSTLIVSAVPPISFAILWDKCSKAAAITGSIVGLGCGITAWLACTKIQYGNLNLDNLQEYAPTLAGAAVAMLVSLFICVLMSLIRPQNYDWAGMKVISVLDDVDAMNHSFTFESTDKMKKAQKNILLYGGLITLVLVVLWPILTTPAKVFSKGYFTMWVIISIIWGCLAAVVCTVLPLWEARGLLANVIGHVLLCRRADKPIPGIPYTTANDLGPKPDDSEELPELQKQVMKHGKKPQHDDSAHGNVSFPAAIGLAA
ncbi:TPA: hypothetical protein ACH3X3_010770 [Trebouxia sp. C0006]